jgi:hypothetical protein
MATITVNDVVFRINGPQLVFNPTYTFGKQYGLLSLSEKRSRVVHAPVDSEGNVPITPGVEYVVLHFSAAAGEKRAPQPQKAETVVVAAAPLAAPSKPVQVPQQQNEQKKRDPKTKPQAAETVAAASTPSPNLAPPPKAASPSPKSATVAKSSSPKLEKVVLPPSNAVVAPKATSPQKRGSAKKQPRDKSANSDEEDLPIAQRQINHLSQSPPSTSPRLTAAPSEPPAKKSRAEKAAVVAKAADKAAAPASAEKADNKKKDSNEKDKKAKKSNEQETKSTPIVAGAVAKPIIAVPNVTAAPPSQPRTSPKFSPAWAPNKPVTQYSDSSDSDVPVVKKVVAAPAPVVPLARRTRPPPSSDSDSD